jgi:glucose-1-phosphatase
MESNIKNLVFDFGGVLVDLDKERCVNHFKTLGAADIEQLLGVYTKTGFFQDYEKGNISDDNFRKQLRSHVKSNVSDAALDEAWNSFLVGIPSNKLECLLQLRRKYNVFLLSNTNFIHWDYSCNNMFTYNGYKVDDFFDKIFLSFKMHEAKPDISIFKTVLSETNINPEETLFLDDSQDNCNTATTLGIHTKLIKPKENWTTLFFNKYENCL